MSLFSERISMYLVSRLVFLLGILINFSSESQAGFILSVGSNVPLLPNTPSQAVDVFLTSTSSLDPDLTGMSLRVYLGNSSTAVNAASEGKFDRINGVVMAGNDYFWGIAADSRFTLVEDSIREANVNLLAGIQKNVLNGAVGPGTVKVATLYIDTSGLFGGTYAISLNDPFSLSFIPGQLTSTLTVPSGTSASSIVPDFQNGSFTITAVPEPSSLLLTAAIAFAGMALRFRKSARIRDAAQNAI